MTEIKALTVVHQHLARGGALCKEFNRVRLTEELDWRVEQAYAMEIIRDSKALQNADPVSIGRSLVDLAVMGLSLSPAKKEAYLIPYKGRCTASPSYMGLEQIGYRTGMLEGIQCKVVRKGDHFREYTDRDGTNIEHEVLDDGSGPVTHAYSIAWLSTGRIIVDVMNRNTLMACRDAAAKKNNGAIPFTWKGAFRDEMYKKCSVRRNWKHWPRSGSPKVRAMLDAVERTDPMDFKEDEAKVVAGHKRAPTFDQSHIDSLCDVMREAGYDTRGWNKQLQGLAVGMGYPAGIRSVLVTEFDRAKELMERGLVAWKERTSSKSAQSDSAQGTTTAQTEAT